MRRLLLLRHGEAQPAAPGGSDVERALTAAGRAEVHDAAGVIAATGLTIDRALVSTARRTLESAEIIAAHLRLAQPPEPLDRLYLASPSVLLQTLERCPSNYATLLVIGHNPGLSELVARLAPRNDSAGLRTAGVCLLTFAIDGWRDVAADIANSCRVLR
ncbi:MAG TPA: histidine phosphatase family protein [Steroidobacteraceae bacterium]|jgi:phosphohistidine phosphatase|nr:histidine phosphatase family protein [Steroidobacteraceae bacterium]